MHYLENIKVFFNINIISDYPEKNTCTHTGHMCNAFEMYQLCCSHICIHLRTDKPQLYQKSCICADCQWSYTSSESGRATPQWLHCTQVHLKCIKRTGYLKVSTYQCFKDAILQTGCGMSVIAIQKSKDLWIDGI